MIDQKFLKSFSPTTKQPIGPCAFCQEGHLYINEAEFHFGEDLSSETYRDKVTDPDNDEGFGWDPDYYTGHFAGLLLCNKCKNKTSISGETRLVLTVDKDSEDYNQAYHIEHCTIKSISPTLKLITFPKSPKFNWTLQTILIKSFDLFWIDNAACANKIRTSIEILLTDLGIPKIDSSGKKLNLHTRIEEFKKINTPIGELLLTLKILGNVGSHSNTVIDREDLLSAFEVLEYVLIELFEPKSSKIQDLSDKIRKKYK
ncbi:hypothetical protein LPTSP2_38870 [Leptospira ellinghausenii]|uniref:DUF4145 domain-containing protein n=1 Tax=Leptospira ellinghausenii TaxID=1917822 RepID=A0A2P2DIZ1_9LEPT|nr:DUF4145 domain-containing protein [Leptospira ellinghausenii]GBF44584.1 hypothetical protein LPTSP2_38870 [Leptospira ellinghausenii]